MCHFLCRHFCPTAGEAEAQGSHNVLRVTQVIDGGVGLCMQVAWIQS